MGIGHWPNRALGIGHREGIGKTGHWALGIGLRGFRGLRGLRCLREHTSPRLRTAIQFKCS